MWYYITPLIYLYPVISSPQNNTDIIRTFDQQLEITERVHPPDDKRDILTQLATESHIVFIRENREPETGSTTGIMIEEATEGVIFIPNDRDNIKNERDIPNVDMIKDVIAARETNISEFVAHTSEPNRDIIFISGKNSNDGGGQSDTDPLGGKGTEKIKLDCTNLNCNNTVNSVCGKKMERKKWKHRLFLNECFFRKVNCHFRHQRNRYLQVPTEECKHTGMHGAATPYFNDYMPMLPPARPDKKALSRRSFSSRRSLSMGIDGRLCSHSCPANCPEDYDPQCAVSATGRKRVFTNHCKMDYNSCFYGVVWHMRPLSQCVGGKKADMRQNRGFISWMQSVGIVDNKGKLNMP